MKRCNLEELILSAPAFHLHMMAYAESRPSVPSKVGSPRAPLCSRARASMAASGSGAAALLADRGRRTVLVDEIQDVAAEMNRYGAAARRNDGEGARRVSHL